MSDALFMVVGCGSIGRRHIRNLSSLGVKKFILCDKSIAALKAASEGLIDPILVDDLEKGLIQKPLAAVVATPSSLHLEMTMRLIKAGVHALVEKPLSHSLDNIDALKAEAAKSNAVVMMAMCYRFHPVFLRLKELLDSSHIGRVLHANYYGGHYLPDWHPYADYRKEYAARKSLGGGVVLTSIHSLDNVRWFFGEVQDVRAFTDRIGSLEIDVEDFTSGVLKMESGSYVTFQIDFLQRKGQHRMIVVGETGTLRVDFVEGIIESFTVESGKWAVERVSFDVNEMYVRESSEFLSAIREKRPPLIGIEEGEKTLRLAMRVKEG